MIGVSDPDLFRFLWLVLMALYTGGAGRLIFTYRRHPPKLTAGQRRLFVYGALTGGTMLVFGFTFNVITNQGQRLAPGTLIGLLGLLVILTTVYVLLWYGRPPPGKERRE